MIFAHDLSRIAQAFEPEPLSGKDLDEFYYSDTMPIRMGDDNVSPMRDIYHSCIKPRQQNAHLLMGHGGCGKSTELNVLKREFEEVGHKVEVVKCRLEADLLGVTYWDLLILLGTHLYKIAEDSECNLPQELVNKIDKFWKTIDISETASSDGTLGFAGGLAVKTPKLLPLFKIFSGLSTEVKLGYEKKMKIRNKVRKSVGQWMGYMKEVADHITQHLYGKQPIIIFEDLDKLFPEKAWKIFDNPLSEMSFPVIYTFPISLSYAPKFKRLDGAFSNNVHTLPMIKIRDQHGNPISCGMDIIKKIVRKRADSSLFDEDALTFLINKTGGVLRDLFRCILRAAGRAEYRNADKIEQEDAQSAINQLKSSLTRLIEIKNNPLLINIYKGSKHKNQIEDKKMLLEMMQGLVVLEYNGERWHDLHPLIEDFLIEQGEVQ